MAEFLKTDSILKRRLSSLMLAAYFVLLLYFTIFAESLGRTNVQAEPRYNLVLFTEIARFWRYRRQLGLWACFLNIFGNILVFMPCGYLIPEVFKSRRSAQDAVTAGFVASLVIECTQFVFAVGSFDVDDLLLNTIGAISGYAVWYAVHHVSAIGKERTAVHHVSAIGKERTAVHHVSALRKEHALEEAADTARTVIIREISLEEDQA